MKKFYFLLTLLLIAFTATAQNLVPNPSFEDTVACPTGTSQIDKATGWKNYGVAGGSPDYFNVCSKDSVPSSSGWYIMAGVPENAMGHQIPKQGNGYAGFFSYHTDTANGVFREIIGIELIQPLQIGVEYFISFSVSPGFGRYAGTGGFSNKTGARFSMQEYDGHWQSTNPAPIDNFAHIYTDSIFTDTTEWHLISGSFIADSAYPYLMLGNFFDNINTDTVVIGSQNYATYYYVDRVCVSSVRNFCFSNTNNIQLIEQKPILTIYPNPASEDVNIALSDNVIQSLSLFDITGRLIYFKDCTQPQTTSQSLSVSAYPSGQYILKVNTPSGQYISQIIIIH